jgi:hypothetical protein
MRSFCGVVNDGLMGAEEDVVGGAYRFLFAYSAALFQFEMFLFGFMYDVDFIGNWVF